MGRGPRRRIPCSGALNSAANDFQTIFNSPLDVDSSLLDIVWSMLVPELDNLRTGNDEPGASEKKATEQER